MKLKFALFWLSDLSSGNHLRFETNWYDSDLQYHTWSWVISKCRRGSHSQDRRVRISRWILLAEILATNFLFAAFTSLFATSMEPSVRVPRGTLISSCAQRMYKEPWARRQCKLAVIPFGKVWHHKKKAALASTSNLLGSWNWLLLIAASSPQKEEMSYSGIPRILAEIWAFWKNLLATFPLVMDVS